MYNLLLKASCTIEHHTNIFLDQDFCVESLSPAYRRVFNDSQGSDDEEEVEDKDIGDEELWIASKWVDLT